VPEKKLSPLIGIWQFYFWSEWI